MSSRENDLLKRWRGERDMYIAWGRFVVSKLTEAIKALVDPMSTDDFVKIPVSARVKDETSLIDKAFYRNKEYANPYDDIEDKVGVRVVVLFADDVKLVENALNQCPSWIAIKARDFEEEQALRPYEFDYQSQHYIVRPTAAIQTEGREIFAGAPCEVQIRTLLQHAYSELTHDAIYKPRVAAQPDVKRAAAKSMALIEATGDYFTEVRKKMASAAAPGEHVAKVVKDAYANLMGNAGAPAALNTLLIDHYRAFAKDDFDASFETFLSEHTYLRDRINERVDMLALYRQPAVLLLYFAVNDAPASARANSPLTDAELAPIYSDLGKGFL